MQSNAVITSIGAVGNVFTLNRDKRAVSQKKVADVPINRRIIDDLANQQGKPGSVKRRFAGRTGLETAVLPEILLRMLPDIPFDQLVDPSGIRHVVLGWKVFQRL